MCCDRNAMSQTLCSRKSPNHTKQKDGLKFCLIVFCCSSWDQQNLYVTVHHYSINHNTKYYKINTKNHPNTQRQDCIYHTV